MLRVQAGDLDAFEQLVERYKSMVYGLALSILRRPEDAEEAAQDAFVKLFRARDRFDGERSLEPWLLRIAGNACRDLARRRRAARLPGQDATSADDVMHVVADPRTPVHGRAVDQMVRHELEQLSERFRLPLELKYLRGMTNHQIAEAMGISISNVKVQVARAKDILQSRLAGEVEA
ncbi:MAG: sigma-70 family RNA polymerase sigma factor [Planctomycetes bacterium]|nr:sigma-70 family RNA polymerase sigma factor [Planctomycetota bacterium]